MGIFSGLLLLVKLFVICSGLVGDLFAIFVHHFLFFLLFLLFCQDDGLHDGLVIGIVLWELMFEVVHCKLGFWVDFYIFIQLQKGASVDKEAFETFDCIITTTIG
jgi:hypothetical protein